MSDNSGLRCPACNSAWSEVTKTMKYDGFVRRYRNCMRCGQNWPTTELSNKPKNIKKDIDFDENDDFVIPD